MLHCTCTLSHTQISTVIHNNYLSCFEIFSTSIIATIPVTDDHTFDILPQFKGQQYAIRRLHPINSL